MKIKLLKSYGMLAAGDTMDTSLGVAEQLIRREIAVEIKEQKRGGQKDTNKAFFAPPKK